MQSATRFIFLTKTPWDEPPRLRHQLARLLAGAGHEVLFFEKPSAVWRGLPSARNVADGITVVGHRELLHHKLRLLPIAHRLNAACVRHSLTKVLGADDVASHVVVNFNYDYWFLRDLFPRNRLMTIINDDFVSTALFGFTRPLEWALERTCVASDRVLTVSAPLQTRLAKYCDAELFLPWADRPYASPVEQAGRNVLLVWAFINTKVDFGVLNSLANTLERQRPEMRIMLVGPVDQAVATDVAALEARPNVELLPAMPLDRVALSRVLAALIINREGAPEIDAIALPNKALQLLARGLPLLICGMPHFIEAPFVFRLRDQDTIDLLDDIALRFWAIQDAIKDFVAANGPNARLEQFFRLIV